MLQEYIDEILDDLTTHQKRGLSTPKTIAEFRRAHQLDINAGYGDEVDEAARRWLKF